MAHPTKPSITVCYVFFQQQLQLPAGTTSRKRTHKIDKF